MVIGYGNGGDPGDVTRGSQLNQEIDATGGLKEETAKDIEDQLNFAASGMQSATVDSELQRSLAELTEQSMQLNLTGPRLRGAEDLDPTEKVIQQTFPDPKITRIEFARDGSTGDLSKIFVEVRVSGDFIGDEWFWADYLEYFKLKVYLVPGISGVVGYNKDFNTIPMYSDDIAIKIKDAGDQSWAKSTGQRQGTVFQFDDRSLDYFTSTKNSNSISIPSLQADLSLKDTYTFEKTLSIEPFYHDFFLKKFANAIVQPNTMGIVARTFFDIEQFKNELLKGADLSALNPITDSNNGKWDFIQFVYTPRKSGPYPVITDVKRRVGYYSDKIQNLWDGTFSVNWLGDGKFYATSDYAKRPGAPSFTYQTQKFNRTNADNLKLQSEIRRKTSTNRN